MLYQPVHPESNISHFHQCSLWGSTLWFFIESSLRVRKSNFKIIFATFLGWLPVSRSSKFGKSIFNRFWGVLWQPVHPKSNIRHFRSFSFFHSVLCYFLEACFWIRKKNFKIVFAPPLGFLAVSRPSLVNWYLTDFGGYSANQCIQNQM